jgi:cephalosporin hydroxylase
VDRTVPTADAAEFHGLFYGSLVWADTYWLGVPVQKCPLDLWVYQEIIRELEPELIIETGTAAGGSALFLASICDLVGQGRVVTVDITEFDRPSHPRIRYFLGRSSTDPAVVAAVRAEAIDAGTVLVVLDSDHSCEHVADELAGYAPLVTPGSYLIVEDTNLNGRPVLADFGPGPAEAVEAFLSERDDFVVDRSREKYGLTFNPGGYLRRSH